MTSRRGRVWLGVLGLSLLGLPVGPGLAAEGGREKKFEITASRYRFEPDRIEVEEGDTVRLVLHSTDTAHGLALRALKLKVEIPKGGAPVELSFVASRAGRYPFECSEYCGQGHKGMKGELVVTARSR